MIAEHTIDWSLQWRQEGREEGREEGRKEGEATVLLRLLTRKYGSLEHDLEKRVRNADAEQLLRWADRFVAASSLEEIFDGNGSG